MKNKCRIETNGLTTNIWIDEAIQENVISFELSQSGPGHPAQLTLTKRLIGQSVAATGEAMVAGNSQTNHAVIVLPVINGVSGGGYISREPGPISVVGLVDERGEQVWYDGVETLRALHPEITVEAQV